MDWFRRIGKWLGFGFGGMVALILLGYAVLVVVNLEDEPPSPTARAFAEALDPDGPIDGPDNAVPFFRGVDAPRGKDPRALGLERIRWSQRHPNKPADAGERAGVSIRTLLEEAGTGLEAWVDRCNPVGRECLRRLKGEGGALERSLADVEWMLSRYDRLLRQTEWHEPPPVLFSLPHYPSTSVMSQLYGLEAWTIASNRDFAEAMNRLGRETRFWRMVLAGSNTIPGKIIAVVHLRWNIGWTNAVTALAAESGVRVEPEDWKQPLRPGELSLRRAFAGDLHQFRQMLLPTEEALRRASWFGRAMWRLQAPLLQLQATKNLFAAKYHRIEEALAVPFEQLPAELEALQAERAARYAEMGWLSLYNPVGRLVFWSVADYPLEKYALRVADLEGARGAMVLANQLRAKGVAAEEVPTRLESAELNNPFTGQPFEWDSATRSLVYKGQSDHGTGDFSVPY